ncbi:MAG: Flp pilus assembly protein CpaB [Deltaproteobacteria bacterium]|nr:Flp pilus assembly protein CpaB [Deltaproteobacteria bacterium]
MGKFKAVIAFVLAVVVALVATSIIYRWVQTKAAAPVQTASKEEKGVQMALAARDLSKGTKIGAGDIKMVSLPEQAIPAGHFKDAAALQGRVLIAQVRENEPITESKLAPVSVTTGGVSAVVSPGKRAIAVAGDKVIGLAGFIQPGNRVDVLVTLKSPTSESHVTKVVLENILVLATGTQTLNLFDGKPGPVDVFTLEVTPEEAEKLSLAASQGKLHFALRNVTDDSEVTTMGTSVSEILDGYKPRMQLVKEPVVKPPPEPKEPAKRAVEIQTIRGTSVTSQSF